MVTLLTMVFSIPMSILSSVPLLGASDFLMPPGQWP